MGRPIRAALVGLGLRPGKGIPVKLAIIDLGSNSVRFDVYTVDSFHRARRVHREKVMVRLGDGVFETGRLRREAVARTVRALKSFGGVIRAMQVDHVAAFATAALRNTRDARALIARVRRETGIAIQVISGREEARLIAKGILSNERPPSGLFALVDIGGGSTEISVCYKRACLDSHSFDLGANRLKQLFLQAPLHKRQRGSAEAGEPPQIKALRRHVKRAFARQKARTQWPEVRTVLGSSGTIRALRRILRKSRGDIPGSIRRSALSALVREMIPMTTKQLLAIPGMEPKRVDLILAGALLLEETLIALGAQVILTTEYSLRDGVLEQEMERLALANP
ncbi:MAG: hypothetical protein IT285_12515 [Bdellovibrionales bacterium]|nr:hypothetical protein [Bdellovibrionales bacterium]